MNRGIDNRAEDKVGFRLAARKQAAEAAGLGDTRPGKTASGGTGR